MAKDNEQYRLIDVESYTPNKTSGPHGPVHIRSLPGQGLPTNLHVECSKKLATNHPPGTQFRIKAKLTDRDGSGDFLYSYFGWKYEVLAKK